MEISSILDDIRSSYPLCSSIAYADLSTGMILAVSTQAEVPQETWDDLCATCVAMFTGAEACSVAATVDPAGGQGVTQAVIVEPQELGVFVRSGANPDDALACVCAPEVDVQALIAHAHADLLRIDADG